MDFIQILPEKVANFRLIDMLLIEYRTGNRDEDYEFEPSREHYTRNHLGMLRCYLWRIFNKVNIFRCLISTAT